MHTFCDHIWQINARCVETIVTKQTKKNRTKPTKNGARSFGSLKLDYRKRSPAKMQPSYTPNALQYMWKRNQIKIVANTYALRLSAISPLPDPIYTTTPPCPSPTCALLPHPNIRHDKTFNGFHLDLGQSFIRAGSLSLIQRRTSTIFLGNPLFADLDDYATMLLGWVFVRMRFLHYVCRIQLLFFLSLFTTLHTRLRIYYISLVTKRSAKANNIPESLLSFFAKIYILYTFCLQHTFWFGLEQLFFYVFAVN